MSSILIRGAPPGALVTLLAASCALGPQGRRYDALVTEYDHGAPRAVLDSGDALFAGAVHLDRAALIRAVLDRNPDVAAARAAWRGALARVPEETAVDDPMVSYAIAPLTIGGARLGQSVEIDEKLPVLGRRALAADVALAEAEATRDDVGTVRLDLALMTSTLFDDYYVVGRSLAITAQHRALVDEMKQAATIRVTSGHGSAQDAIEAEMEAVHVDHDRLMLESQRDVIVAGLDELLHRAPEAPLPPPPDALPPTAMSDTPVAALEAEALASRPELSARRARARGSDSAIALADREAFPQVSVMGRYDAMWDAPEMRWMIGVSVEVPLARDRRHAAVDRAEADAAQARSELDGAADKIRTEVAQAARRVEEAQHLVRMYDEQLLPLGRRRVDAARAGFVADQNDFNVMLAAERELRAAELDREKLVADLSRRQAELDRAVGRVPGIGGAP